MNNEVFENIQQQIKIVQIRQRREEFRINADKVLLHVMRFEKGKKKIKKKC